MDAFFILRNRCFEENLSIILFLFLRTDPKISNTIFTILGRFNDNKQKRIL